MRVCSVGAVLCVIMYVEVSGSTLCMRTCVPNMWKMVVVLVHVCACMGQANAIKKKEKHKQNVKRKKDDRCLSNPLPLACEATVLSPVLLLMC